MAERDAERRRLDAHRRVFGVLFLVTAFFFFWTLSPLWVPIFLGGLLALATSPWHARFVRRMPRHPRLLSAAITAASLFLLVGVVGGIVFTVVRELLRFLTAAVENWRVFVPSVLFREPLGHLLRRLNVTPAKIEAQVHGAMDYALQNIAAIAQRLLALTSSSLILILFTAITAFYLLLDGKRLAAWLVDIVPLPKNQTRELLREFSEVSRAILIGNGVTAVYQGTLTGAGLWIFGVPDPVAWGALAAVASVVPAFGTTIVWIPISVVMIALGHTGAALGIIVWCSAVVVGLADYVIRPRILERGMRLHSLLVFIALFGGIEAFGLMGLILGPLFVSLFVAILRIYSRAYRPAPAQRDLPPSLGGAQRAW